MCPCFLLCCDPLFVCFHHLEEFEDMRLFFLEWPLLETIQIFLFWDMPPLNV